MKRKIIVSCAAIMMVCVSVSVFHETMNYDSLVIENAEALSDGENPEVKGRWKTVACENDSFSSWGTYCCPSDYYDNCEGRIGTCASFPYNGCQDTFWYK